MTDLIQPTVVVLMASYNGARYITEQIDSILQQSYSSLLLVIRDDGSSDETLKLIERYQDARITLLRKDRADTESGHRANFAALVAWAYASDYQYFCFADQDDVWHQDKIANGMRKLQAVELPVAESANLADQGKPMLPALVHTDLCVVDKNLAVLAESFFHYQGLPSPDLHTATALLYQNIATGCTMIFNRPLLAIAHPVPDDSPVHDWWFMLCAQYAGKVAFLRQPSLLYRQHGGNSIGAVPLLQQYNIFSGYFYRYFLRFPKNAVSAYRQAQCLSQRQGVEMTKELAAFNQLETLSLFRRIQLARKSYNHQTPILKKLLVLLLFVFFPLMYKFQS